MDSNASRKDAWLHDEAETHRTGGQLRLILNAGTIVRRDQPIEGTVQIILQDVTEETREEAAPPKPSPLDRGHPRC